jgi:hypothetical protein
MFELVVTGWKYIFSGFLNMYAVSMSSFSSLLGFDVCLILARTSKNLQLFTSAVNCTVFMSFGLVFLSQKWLQNKAVGFDAKIDIYVFPTPI